MMVFRYYTFICFAFCLSTDKYWKTGIENATAGTYLIESCSKKDFKTVFYCDKSNVNN